MAILGDDVGLDQLIEQTKLLFQQQRPAGKPSGSSPGTTYLPSPADNTAAEGISDEGFQPPIKNEWKNSGGFSLVSPNAWHPNGHMGVDMRAQAGTPIYPLAAGVVTNVGTDPKGGNVVNVQHPNGVRTYYAHCSTVKVHKGDKVDKNTIIATVGNSGNAQHSVPHLHFQVWKDGQIQDPAKFFSIPKYTNIDAAEKQKGYWFSDEAQQEATAFNMKDHVTSGKMAFTRDVAKLTKLARAYCKLAVQGSWKNL